MRYISANLEKIACEVILCIINGSTPLDRARRNYRRLARLEQHQLNLHIQLDKVKEEINIIKILQKAEDLNLLHHPFPQPTATVFQNKDQVQITNRLREEFGTFFTVINVSNNNHRVSCLVEY